jgi:hypothetical protein
MAGTFLSRLGQLGVIIGIGGSALQASLFTGEQS